MPRKSPRSEKEPPSPAQSLIQIDGNKLPIGYVSLDKDGRVIAANPKWYEILSYSQDEVRGRWFGDFVAPESQSSFRERFVELPSKGELRNIKLSMVRKDGRLVKVLFSGTVERDPSGQIKHIHSFFSDYLESLNPEQVLAQSEHLLQELVDHMSSCVAVYEARSDGEEFVFVYFNEAAERAEEIGKEDVIGKSALTVFPGVKEFGLFDVLRRVWQTGTPEHFPLAEYKDDRIQGWRENYVYKLPLGEVVSIYEDVTERKLAEEKLRWLASFPADNPNPVLRIESDGTLLFVNAASETLLQEWECQVGQLVPSGYQDLIRRSMQEGIQTEEVQVGDRYLFLTFSPVVDEGYVSVYSVDITSRKQLEEEARWYTHRLETLRTIDLAVLKAVSPHETAQAALDRLGDLVPLKRASIAQFDLKANSAVLLAVVTDVPDSALQPGEVMPIEAFCGPENRESGEARVVADITALADPTPSDHVLLAEGVRSYASIPLCADGELVGSLNLGSASPGAFGPNEFEIANEVASQLAIALRQSVLHQKLEERSEELQQGVSRLTAAQEEIEQGYKQLRLALGQSIEALASASEARDPYTAGHQRRVAQLAFRIGQEMHLAEHQCEGLHIAALVHDIGKIGVPAEILSMPRALSAIEFSLIKMHAEIGSQVLSGIDFPWPVADIVLRHHERLDGSGYPGGLKGTEIPLEARIIAVADTVEAMSSHRPYRPALGVEKALEEISKNKDILYDAQVVETCIRLFEEGFVFEKDNAA